MTSMKKIGLIGGLSWQSTQTYYRLLNEGVAARRGGLHSARIVLSSVDFGEVARMQSEGRWEDAGALLAAEARGLQAAGADLFLICANTMHKVAEQVTQGIEIPLIHLGDATAAAVAERGIDTVGLLGTAYTMEQDFYRDRIAAHGLSVLVPEQEDRDEVHRIIYAELCQGIVQDGSRRALIGVIDRLRDRGAQGIILGCTELELILDPDGPSATPYFATTRIHVEAALAAALDD